MIEAYAKIESKFQNKSLEIIDFVDEGISAKDLKRAALQKLITAVKNKELNFILIVKLDRLTRSLKDLIYLNELFEKHGTNLISIKEKIDTNTAQGRFFTSILGSLGQLEREQISERVKDVLKQIVIDQSVGGRTPLAMFILQKLKRMKDFISPIANIIVTNFLSLHCLLRSQMN